MADYPFDSDVGEYILRQVTAKAQTNVTPRITSVEIERTIEGASNLTVVLADPDGELLADEHVFVSKNRRDSRGRPRLNAIDLEIDERWYRLQAVAADNGSVTLTFEDRSIVYLKQKNKRTKASRDSITRAQFVHRLVRAVKSKPIGFYSPDERKRQPIRSSKDQVPDEVVQDERKKGISDTAELKGKDGVTLNREQLRNADRVLRTAASHDAGLKATKALVEACLIEAPNFSNPTGGDSSSVGILQLLDSHLGGSTSTDGGRRDIERVCSLFLTKGFYGKGGAITLAKNNPGWTAGQVAQACQGSAHPERYDQVSEQADAIIDAFGGVSSSGSSLTETEYEFRVEKDENYWEAIQRLAEQVQWRAFMDYRRGKPTVVYLPEEGDGNEASLIRQKTAGVIDRDSPRIVNFRFDWDVGKPVSEAEVEITCDRWHYRPGTALELRGCGPANGKWLVTSILRNVEDPFSKLTLKQPMQDLAEPAPELEQVERSNATTTDDNGDIEGGGAWKLGANANRSGAPMRGPIKEFLGYLANATNEEIVVTTGTRHDQMTASGNVSDHWTGDAADLAFNGDARTSNDVASKGDNIAIAALIVCGKSRSEATRILRAGRLNFSEDFHWTDDDGVKHRVQVGWRTDVGGNHWNHVHVGVAYGGTQTGKKRNADNERTPDARATPGKNQPRTGPR